MVKNHKIGIKIGIVVSRFNSEITELLLMGALQRLHELGLLSKQIDIARVPGAIEIPLAAQRLARTQEFEAIICLGAVIKGETYHFDAVCQQVSYGCQRVGLLSDIPIIFGVLTVESEEQAYDRIGGSHGHAGYAAADAAIELVDVLSQIEKKYSKKKSTAKLKPIKVKQIKLNSKRNRL